MFKKNGGKSMELIRIKGNSWCKKVRLKNSIIVELESTGLNGAEERSLDIHTYVCTYMCENVYI